MFKVLQIVKKSICLIFTGKSFKVAGPLLPEVTPVKSTAGWRGPGAWIWASPHHEDRASKRSASSKLFHFIGTPFSLGSKLQGENIGGEIKTFPMA